MTERTVFIPYWCMAISCEKFLKLYGDGRNYTNVQVMGGLRSSETISYYQYCPLVQYAQFSHNIHEQVLVRLLFKMFTLGHENEAAELYILFSFKVFFSCYVQIIFCFIQNGSKLVYQSTTFSTAQPYSISYTLRIQCSQLFPTKMAEICVYLVSKVRFCMADWWLEWLKWRKELGTLKYYLINLIKLT